MCKGSFSSHTIILFLILLIDSLCQIFLKCKPFNTHVSVCNMIHYDVLFFQFGALTPLEPRLGKKLIEPLTNLIHRFVHYCSIGSSDLY